MDPGGVKNKPMMEGMIHPFPGNGTITDFFKFGFKSRWTRMYPQRVALIQEEPLENDAPDLPPKVLRMTYGELESLSDKLALEMEKELDSLSILGGNDNPDGEMVIGVALPPSDKLILTIFAILKLGGVYLPLGSFSGGQIRRICSEIRPSLVIIESSTQSKFDGISPSNARIIKYETLFESMLNQEFPLEKDRSLLINPIPGIGSPAERTALIVFTRGDAIGVRISHRAIMNRLFWMWKRFPYVQEEVCCLRSDPTHSDSIGEIFGPLLQGYPLVVLRTQPEVLLSEPDIKAFIEKVSLFRITRVVLQPLELKGILEHLNKSGEIGKFHTRTLSTWICTGAHLPSHLLEAFFNLLGENVILCNFYGAAEVCGDVIYEVFSSGREVKDKTHGSSVPIGKPVYNNLIYLLDDNLKVVTEGNLGEIYIGGFSLANGIIGSKIPNSRFIRNPYSKTKGYDMLFKTGDYGHVGRTRHKNQAKALFLDGKKERLLKVKGHRVSMNELEAYLDKNALVREVAVLPIIRSGNKVMVAFVVLTSPQDKSLAALKEVMGQKLKEHEKPEFLPVSEIPRLSNGRVNALKLNEIYEEIERANQETIESNKNDDGDDSVHEGAKVEA